MDSQNQVKNTMEAKDLVSIIVPVYNTEKYLDKCIQSILGQTYKNLDILFINDGSTDGSLQILEKYQAQDDRIRIFSKENGGQGLARNLGIEQAKGGLLMFVDSDDWISDSCVEALHKALTKNRYDISMGDMAKTYYEKEDVESILGQITFPVMDSSNKQEWIFRVSNFPVAKLYRKSLFIDYSIRFPGHCFEDTATLPLLYAVADKVCYVRKNVYYYRSREGSTVNNLYHIYDRIKCIASLKKGFQKLGLYDEYREQIREYALFRSKLNRKKVKELAERTVLDFEAKQEEFDYQNFGIRYKEIPQERTYTFGSYNLMISSKLFSHLADTDTVRNYYGYQNIISCTGKMNEKLNALNIISTNSWREKLVIQDFEKTFMHLNPGRFKNIDYFIMDFLEERYDTGCYHGEYFTISDGFRDIEQSLNIQYSTIKSFTKEWQNLWYAKCDLFIQRVKKYVDVDKIILVKMKMSEKYMEDGREFFFPETEKIKKANAGLEECYQYFIRQCPEAIVVEPENLECYYTDKNFRHGCFPWHLNEKAYKAIADEMEKCVMAKR